MSLIITEQLTKTFNGTSAVDGLNLSIKEGICTALLGPNGAGKTTTLNMLTGLMNPTSGTITFDQRYRGDRRQFIGYLPQYPKFYGWMTGEEYVVYAGQLGGLSKIDATKKTEELLSLVGLDDSKKKRIAGYSGGMKQRLGIAQALVHSPKLIILDEPVSALDPIGRRDVLELMRKLKEKTSILFSTHVLHDAEEICDDIFIVKDGKVVIEGDLVELQRKYQKPTIYLETEESIEYWSHSIKNMDWLRHMQGTKNKLTITVNDIDVAREALLSNETLRKLKITNFEIAKTTLEDLFMEVTAG
ncbi:ABC transporter ATP-binding protein [Evansella sp. AB-P1]|uniref:ABC transporter ATP-binding protein n=1 Tax=Evansella sp. AB-P1 TaxID=3037653 RepID=UPI00241F6491|nr:ABC transporter ATP-binding protein [Evansella sp. AB-P1]MDG5790085.1 ABC transporter ATP-binding protein [Evansella sp. AB-P1]